MKRFQFYLPTLLFVSFCFLSSFAHATTPCSGVPGDWDTYATAAGARIRTDCDPGQCLSVLFTDVRGNICTEPWGDEPVVFATTCITPCPAGSTDCSPPEWDSTLTLLDELIGE